MNTYALGPVPRFDCFTRPVIVCAEGNFTRDRSGHADMGNWAPPGDIRNRERTINLVL